jgi:hypothetical protein
MPRVRKSPPRTFEQMKSVRGSDESSTQNRLLTLSKDRSHLRKQSISPPFNFQHLSHTRRKHVPGLGTVDESGSFRVPANPQPIEPVKSRPTTPCLPSSGPGPQHSSSRSVDISHGRQTAPSTVVRPRAASCQTRNGNEPISQVVGLSMSNPNIPATSAAIPPITAQVQHCSPSEIKYRAKQPLPALPQRATSQGHPKRMTQDSQLSCSTTSSSDSYRSSTHMRTAGPWTCLDEHGSTVEPFEASWEEDVDFCYEREAESTCDFNWDENEQIDAGFRLSKYLQPIEGSRNSALFASPIINASPVQPRRSSIVGHRGFLQARNNSVSHATADDRASGQENQDQLVSITEESKPIFGPEIMHNDTSLENSSDSASTRTGTSFYDDSDAHPVPLSGDNGHSSVASLSSVPELMPSSYSTSSNDATASTEHVAPLPSRQSFSSCDVMRKPSTLSNRAILQAGRVVQRGRVSSNASMGGRISRMPSKQFQRPVADGEEATTWI